MSFSQLTAPERPMKIKQSVCELAFRSSTKIFAKTESQEKMRKGMKHLFRLLKLKAKRGFTKNNIIETGK